MELSASQQLAQLNQKLAELLEQKAQLERQIKSELSQPKCEQVKDILVIGGAGQLGRRFVELFSQSGHRVSVLEKPDWPADLQSAQAQKLFNRDLILVTVPIDVTETVIGRLPSLPGHCVLADITSIKQKPLQKMLQTHAGPVVGLHPMFGPDVQDFDGQTIVVCDGRCEKEYQWIVDLLRQHKARLHFTEARIHDQTMAIVQVLRHFSTVAYGHHLSQEQVSLQEILAMSSPIYRLELAMVGRLFAQDPHLYAEIIFAEPANIKMMRRFVEGFSRLLELVEQGDKTAFEQAFLQTRTWFGDYADKFLKESGRLLAATHQVKKEFE